MTKKREQRPRNLTAEQIEWIVVRFALYEKPHDVHKKFNELFELNIPFETIRNYNLNFERGRKKASQRTRDIFENARQHYLDGVTSHPTSLAAVRVEMLGDMAIDAKEKGNYRLAAELLEQVAKETGGLFTNELRVRGKVAHEHAKAPAIPQSMDEMRNMLADRLGEALVRLPPTSKPN